MPLRKHGTLIKLASTATLAAALMTVPSSASAGILGSSLTPTVNQVTSQVKQVAPAAAPVVDAVSNAVVTPVATTPPPTCTEVPTTKAFAKFGDKADYSPAPNGTFESSTVGWKLGKGASIVKDNDTLGVTSGSKALKLGTGAIATSPEFCVSEANPYFRFVAKAGFFFSTYQALVLYRDSAGTLTQAQFVSSQNTQLFPGIWTASAVSPLATKIPLLSGGKTASVQIVMASLFGGASIDSVMVDPYRRG
jgi:hypothetical protein